MKYVINDDCIRCGVCAAECPQDCIHDGDDHYQIDKEACIGCGACAGVCPVEAIHEDAE